MSNAVGGERSDLGVGCHVCMHDKLVSLKPSFDPPPQWKVQSVAPLQISSIKTWQQDQSEADAKVSPWVETLQDWRKRCETTILYDLCGATGKCLLERKFHSGMSYSCMHVCAHLANSVLANMHPTVGLAQRLFVGTVADGKDKVDLDETQKALISLRREEAEPFWAAIQDETDAEIFLQQLHNDGMPHVSLLGDPTKEQL